MYQSSLSIVHGYQHRHRHHSIWKLQETELYLSLFSISRLSIDVSKMVLWCVFFSSFSSFSLFLFNSPICIAALLPIHHFSIGPIKNNNLILVFLPAQLVRRSLYAQRWIPIIIKKKSNGRMIQFSNRLNDLNSFFFPSSNLKYSKLQFPFQ